MKSPNELSFLPDDYLERKAQRRTNAICATLFMIVMVAIGTAFTYTERTLRAVEQDYAAIEDQYTEAAKRIQQVQQMQEKQRTMAMQAELTSSLLEKVPRSFLLAEITNSMPRGVSLLDVTLESKLRSSPQPAAPPRTTFERRQGGAPAAPAKPTIEPRVYDVFLKITGIAATDVQVAQFITRLNQSRLLKDVNLIISDEFKTPDETVRRFQIEMMVHPQADVASINEKPNVTAVEMTK